MSLDNNTKRQLNDIVDAIDNRIETAIDKREVEAKKQGLFGKSSHSDFSSTINKEWKGIQDVFNKKALEHNIEFKSMKITDQTGDVVGLDNGGLKDIQRGYFDITTVMPQVGLSNDSGEYRYIVNSSETSNFDAVAEGSDSAEDQRTLEATSLHQGKLQMMWLNLNLLFQGEDIKC